MRTAKMLVLARIRGDSVVFVSVCLAKRDTVARVRNNMRTSTSTKLKCLHPGRKLRKCASDCIGRGGGGEGGEQRNCAQTVASASGNKTTHLVEFTEMAGNNLQG